MGYVFSLCLTCIDSMRMLATYSMRQGNVCSLCLTTTDSMLDACSRLSRQGTCLASAGQALTACLMLTTGLLQLSPSLTSKASMPAVEACSRRTALGQHLLRWRDMHSRYAGGLQQAHVNGTSLLPLLTKHYSRVCFL